VRSWSWLVVRPRCHPSPPPIRPLAAPPVTAAAPSAAIPPPPPAPSAAEVLAAQLAAKSVHTRLPELAKRHAELSPSPHAIPLALVAEAIERAELDMFVSYAARDGEAFPILDYELTDAGHFPTYPEGDVSTGLLKKYGGTTYLGYVSGGPGYILSHSVEPRPLRDRSPGLIWSVDVDEGEVSVLFVSLDGECHGLAGASVDPQVGSPDRWPPPVSSPAFGRMAFTVGRRSQTRSLEGVDQALSTCAEGARKRLSSEEIQAEPELEARWVRRNCQRQIAAWERTFAALIEDDFRARSALVDRAKARLGGAAAGARSGP
jgi:hypothetical protein